MGQKIQSKQSRTTLPSSDLDWTIHSLNIQGTFFERWCQEEVKKSHWNIVSTNYPVEFPKHNGPLTGEQSSLDIYAQLAKETILLTLLIECKKNNPEFIDWVFFAHPNPKRSTHFTGSLIGNRTLEGTGHKWEPTQMLSPMISLEWIQTSDAWETRGRYSAYKQGDKTRTSNTAISQSAHQIALATKSIFAEELHNNQVISSRSINAEMPYIHQIFIPTIVTTAKLYVCKFDPKDVDEKTGEIPFSKATLEEQPYLLYEYPLPVHFHSEPLDKVGVIKTGNREFGTRMDIIVVNSSKLSEFLLKLESGNA
ncbi:hypothetical protein A3A63_01080 [Candidatus Gottesmanbacteria bacterium RIFCSPLOWO2_01_FULL_46_9]|uniref:Uncharacterized protein n=1 Tax=Candidatus Gottesmanbacteria bacterium RIFCSPLOWO2_01_FULL_46_9 TaxID=1798394 RepID=A0A1F6B3M0_9BACT|nr:MAG: hypothetical protein A3A63_01080 [Candidatus Gottesmanbacteria bacterium RIFCSPLOWO2_01_FULL_46_9]